MKNNLLQILLTDSSERAKLYAQGFAVFAAIYHSVFMAVFYFNGVMPMVYINIVSVPFYLTLALITPALKNYVIVYLLSWIEIFAHQILGMYCLGSESGFQYFFIPLAIFPFFTFKERFSFAMVISIIGGIVFMCLELFQSHFTAVYKIPETTIKIIFAANLFLSVAVILSTVFIYAYIAWFAEKNLEIKVLNKSREIVQKDRKVFELQKHTFNSLANLVESRDSETGEHIQRTSRYVEMIANEALAKGIYPDEITELFVEKVTRAAPMHDIGKIVITDSILKKPCRLTDNEYNDIKKHTIEGAKIVSEIIRVSDDADYVRITREVALSHHERWDGKGYPNQLKGQDIPISARIMSIADVFDALVSERCYKKQMPIEEAFAIISHESGKQFDPVLVEVFLGLKDKICSQEKFL
ncbi:HD-GYP domain-containing protein [Treponema sp.]|uniref:HD-GYP domain-containing protein n=1 Tax=Treponema sp. TaxID=166 RepID=UPI00298D9BED|nr:HD domain-containing phosphohydrolase [Treponema sp.]